MEPANSVVQRFEAVLDRFDRNVVIMSIILVSCVACGLEQGCLTALEEAGGVAGAVNVLEY